MKISVIIPTCDRTRKLRKCLECLIPQLDPLGNRVEVLVCDDGRSDETRSMIRQHFPIVQWFDGPKRGPAVNRNFGASKASGDWLIFLDDDCLPVQTYLSAYCVAISENPEGQIALEGRTVRPAPPSLLWEAPHNPAGGCLISCNFAIQKRCFDALGGFDQRYPFSFEDIEFAARFSTSGGKVIFVKQALVEHPLRPIPSASTLASRWEGKAIISLDYRASPLYVMLRLPWHALRIIQYRFRGKPLSKDNIRAAFLFAHEWLIVCWKTPGWVRIHARNPRSDFWARHFATNSPVPKFGF